MRSRIPPEFVHKQDEPRFFVRPLESTDIAYADGYRYQIQLLNEDELGEATIEFRAQDTDFSDCPVAIPDAVIAAARSGISDYIDGEGFCRNPGFLGGGRIPNSR